MLPSNVECHLNVNPNRLECKPKLHQWENLSTSSGNTEEQMKKSSEIDQIQEGITDTLVDWHVG